MFLYTISQKLLTIPDKNNVFSDGIDNLCVNLKQKYALHSPKWASSLNHSMTVYPMMFVTLWGEGRGHTISNQYQTLSTSKISISAKKATIALKILFSCAAGRKHMVSGVTSIGWVRTAL